MSEELMVIATETYPAVAEKKGKNYIITPQMANTVPTELIRDVDFGMLPKTKKPTLLKPGAEKIIAAYHFMPRYEIVSCIEYYDPKQGAFFHYTVKCSLYKGAVNPGSNEFIQVEYANGFGSCNTNESSFGASSGVNAANNALKKAQKRAMLQAVLAVSCLSSMFTQDMEDESGIQAKDLLEQRPTDRINSKQNQRLFAVAGQQGMTTEQFRQWLMAHGYPKTRDITVQQFEKIIEELKKLDETESK